MNKVQILAGFVAGGVLVVAVATPTLVNIWSLASDRGFFIPAESSIFTFRVTETNPGSGDWWLYAEDPTHFFALDPQKPQYLVQSRHRAGECKGFSQRDYTTWCAPTAMPIP